jgi:hypothetical protein
MQVYKLHYKSYCTFTVAAAEKAGNMVINIVFVHRGKALAHPANNLPAFNLSTSSTCNIHTLRCSAVYDINARTILIFCVFGNNNIPHFCV